MSSGNRVQIQEHSKELRDKLKQNAGEKAKSNSTPRLVKLISIKLKEAALDSPSFRASVNYFNSQIDQTEQWIDGLLKSLRRYPQQFNDFKEVNNVLFNQLIPDFLKDGLINQDNSASILDTSKTNLSSLWQGNLNLLEIKEAEIVELLTDLSKNHLKHYREIRKNFDFFQTKFDTLLSKYAAQNKTKEPSALREDAFQLYEVRKSYLSASLDICVEIAKLHQCLDSSLVSMAEMVLKDKDSFDEKYLDKVKAWSVAISASVKTLLNDMQYSRNQIEESTNAQFLPSRDLKVHNPALINPSTLTEPDLENPEEKTYEKHGWLFMKTTVGKPARQIWVRRWVFVKSGIFGLFSLAPSKNFVQETDKIGVLLSNIRYAPDEDRRFCFEIKTIDVTIVFQAETLKELKSWLRVFSLEKQRAIENSDSEAGEYAFGRYPPLLYEFASTSLTSVDVELTSSRFENTRNDDTQTTVVSSYLSQLVGGNENLDFRASNSAGEFQEPDVNTPIVTKMSKCSILAHAFLDSTVIPTAVTANIWGSVNWGMYYVSDNLTGTRQMKKQAESKENNLSSLSKTERYPSYYPANLKNYDVQLKALFDTGIPKDELVVTHFSCLWALNPKQELSGRCFVTTQNCYFYLNSTGFVSLMKKPLSDLVAVDVTIEKDWDTLKVYDIDGLNMKGRIFLDDGRLVQKKLDFLINNHAKTKPKPQSEVIPLLEALEAEELKKVERKQSVRSEAGPSVNPELQSFQPFSGVVSHNKSMKTNYYNEYDQCTVRTYDAPAKAIFHILFGDHSNLLREAIRLIDNDEFIPTPWYQSGSELARTISFKMKLSTKMFNLRDSDNNVKSGILQSIEDFVDDKYYRIKELRIPFKVPSGDVLQIQRKYVVSEVDAKTSRLFIYSKIDHTSGSAKTFWAKILSNTTRGLQKEEEIAIADSVEFNVQRLGSHGKIIKAIRTFGNLSKAEGEFSPQKPVVFEFSFNLLMKFYIKRFLYAFAAVILKISRLGFLCSLKLLENLSMNKFLLFLLGLSVFFNVFLTGKSTVSFWTAKRAEHLVRDFANELSINKMERSIYLSEVDALSSFNFNASSQCFDKFINSEVEDTAGSKVDHRFKESRHQLAVKRNEMLVELKILEKIEKELVAGSWKNFLLSELHLCKVSLEEMNVKDASLEQYCSSCIEEFGKISKDHDPDL